MHLYSAQRRLQQPDILGNKNGAIILCRKQFKELSLKMQGIFWEGGNWQLAVLMEMNFRNFYVAFLGDC